MRTWPPKAHSAGQWWRLAAASDLNFDEMFSATLNQWI